MTASSPRIGVWLIGARGSVATTAVLGAAALRHGLAEPTGCVTAAAAFASACLPGYGDLVFGGHDFSPVPMLKRAEQLAAERVFPADLLIGVADDLRRADDEVRTPAASGDGRTQQDVVSALAADITDFRQRHGLDTVVVINVASTEPVSSSSPAHETLAALEAALAGGEAPLPASSAYAYAALRAGCGYVNFTPSTGMGLPALGELAAGSGLPYAGNDGKTGQTLIRSALAPALASRGLRVRAWSGTNLLGGGDGAALADPAAAASKNASKARGIADILGDGVEGETHIDYVPAMGEWKTAWDHVAFDGFLGTRMTMQVTWQGCDSALAAPLVLDLARLTARAQTRGIGGALSALAFFFKDPVGTARPALGAQYETLVAWAQTLADGA